MVSTLAQEGFLAYVWMSGIPLENPVPWPPPEASSGLGVEWGFLSVIPLIIPDQKALHCPLMDRPFWQMMLHNFPFLRLASLDNICPSTVTFQLRTPSR